MAESFEEFYRADYSTLLRFVMSRGVRLQSAEEVVQDVMAEALKNWETLRNPRGWVRTAASHRLVRQEINDRRRAKVARLLGIRDRVDTSAAGRTKPEWEPSSRHAGIEAVRAALAQLPPAQREVMAYYIDGYRPEEIAREIGKTSAAVRANLREARRRLRDTLGDWRPEE